MEKEMKKNMTSGMLVFLAVFLLIFSLGLASSANNTSSDNVASDNGTSSDDSSISGEQTKIDKAYNCLKNKVEEKGCSQLSMQQKIVAFLARSKCKEELLDASKGDGKCWPKEGCDVKTTSQALLALKKNELSYEKPKKWLKSQNKSPETMTWFLQVESNSATTCEVTYDNDTHTFELGKDKKLDSSAGRCFSLSSGDYWLRVSPSCYRKKFEISCDRGFQTNLLFRRMNSNVIHVLEETSQVSAEASVTEEISALCLSNSGGNECDYEGTLWASLALYQDGAYKNYLPYLITEKDANSDLFPDSFLFFVTNDEDYRSNILKLQQEGKYWEIGDRSKFYDTALALKSLTGASPGVSDAKNWLLEEGVQGDNGCWENSIVNTGLLLWAGWDRDFDVSTGTVKEETVDCESQGFDCVSNRFCNQENIKQDYTCGGASVCCTKPLTCERKGGIICNENQKCEGADGVDAQDVNYGQTCCVEGTCVDIAGTDTTQESECSSEGNGECKFSCSEAEEELVSYSCSGEKKCCREVEEPETEEEGGGWWIWVVLLVILIALVALGIIYRDKLKNFLIKIKSKFSKGKGGQQQGGPSGGKPPGAPPGGGPPGRRPPRGKPPGGRPRKMPPGKRPPGRRPSPKGGKPVDNTLQKLKQNSQQ